MKKQIFIIGALVFSMLICHAGNTSQQVYTYVKGLSNSSVTCIFQDSDQIMWFGTWDGLNAYNGKDIISYFPEPENDRSISNNIIRSITESKNGTLWITTDWGINRFDLARQKFYRYFLGYEKLYPAFENIYSVAVDKEGCVFGSARGYGLTLYNPANDEFEPVNTPKLKTHDIARIDIDHSNRLWIMHTDGSIDAVSWQLKDNKLIIIEVSCVVLPGKARFMARKNNFMTVVDEMNNLHLYNTASGVIKEWLFSSLLLPEQPSSIVIEEDMLYIGYASGGYRKYGLSRGMAVPADENLFKKNSNVLSLFVGSQEILWIGTDGNGVVMKHNAPARFNLPLRIEPQKPIRSFMEDLSDNLLVGSKGEGVFLFSLLNNGYRCAHHFTVQNGLIDNNIYSMVRNGKGDIFMGGDGYGINVYRNGKIEKIRFLYPQTKENYFSGVYSMVFTHNDSLLWLGTSGYGLVKLVVREEQGRYYADQIVSYRHISQQDNTLPNNTIFKILPVSENRIWLATRGGGLVDFDPEKEMFRSIQHKEGKENLISNNDVLSLCIDSDGALWVGTSSGLNKLTPKGDTFRTVLFTYKNGMPNNTVHGILEDSKGYIWASTNNGLVKIDRINNKLTRYFERNGLQSNEFSDGAYYKSNRGGYLMFGGVNGANIFKPEDITPSRYIPMLYCNDFKISNTSVLMDERVIMEGDKKVLRLAYDENFFSLNVIALDYIHNENCEYTYWLEGFNKEWVNNGTSSQLVFSNVRPGKYTLWLRYTNNDKEWSAPVPFIDIIVRNPWWLTWYAYTLYLMLAVTAVIITVYFMRRHAHRKQEEIVVRLQKQEQEKITEAKLRFFTNIAHEFCTPISLIYGPCEKLLQHPVADEYIHKYTKIIKSNAYRMQRLISELMDFRKAVTGFTRLQYSDVNVNELVQCITDNFTDIATENQIRFMSKPLSENIHWISDWGCLEKILFNLISNAFKYTPVSGCIDVEFGKKNDMFIFQITNSGEGLRPEELNMIFNRFVILEDFENETKSSSIRRNGIGLALAKSLTELLGGDIVVTSEIKKYVRFTVSLPRPDITPESLINNRSESMLSSDENITDECVNILVVDDEKDIRYFLKDILNVTHWNIYEAANGVAALEWLKTERIDLIITDMVMPEMDGITFIKEVKENNYTKHIPVIFLSGKADEEDKILAIQTGSDTYITKPFHPKHILAAINSILRQRKNVKEFYTSAASSISIHNGNRIHKDDQKFLNQFIKVVEAYLEDEEISPDLISSDLNISRVTLYRKIKEITDETPGELIRKIKLRKSAELLVSTKFSVLEIMYSCGFNNKSYFYREFAKMYNITPKKYRESKSCVDESGANE